MPKKRKLDIVPMVGRRIAELRQKRMTQAEFAEAMGTSVQWVSRVEMGENLTLTTIDKIASVLDVQVTDLFEPPAPEATVVKKGRPRKSKQGL